MRQAIKRLVFGTRVISQWRAVGIENPPCCFRLWLEGKVFSVDVTGKSSVAALRPVTFAIGAGDGIPEDAVETGRVFLRVRPDTGDAASAAPEALGEIALRFSRRLPGDAGIALFTVAGHRNGSLPRADYLRFRLRQRWDIFRDKAPYNFRMIPSELFALYLFYYVPRPVFLVSVAFEGATNIFPMDLVGRLGGDRFLLALRSTSPAIRLMTGSKRLALTAVPFAEKDVAYALGKHHKKETVDWATLPFSSVLSPGFGLHVPASALGVREVEVEATEHVDTHVLFVTRIVREETWRPGPQLCHIPGILREYLTSISSSVAPSEAARRIDGL